MLESVDAIVLGADHLPDVRASTGRRVTPDDEPVAEPINRLPKHVVSNTLDRAPVGRRRGRGRSAATASSRSALSKERYAGDLIVWGSLTLADSLFDAGLVDVLRLRIVPTLLGSGRGIAPATLTPTSLELTASQVHPGGQITLQYAVKPAT